jgi:hypothetical protein
VSRARPLCRPAAALVAAATGLLLYGSPALAAEGHGFTGSFDGSPGTELLHPWGIDVDGAGGIVLVADAGHSEVARFNLAGVPAEFTSLKSNELTGEGAPSPFAGETTGVSDAPGGGDVYVADMENNVVDVFSSAGKYISQITGAGTPQGPFSGPFQVRVSPSSGDLWVIDIGHDTVDEFKPEEAGKKFSYLTQVEASGLAEPLSLLVDLAVDSAGDLYVAGENTATGQFQVDKFNASGVFQDVIDPKGGTSVAVDTSTTPNDVYVLEGGEKPISAFEATSTTGIPYEEFSSPEGHSLQNIGVASTSHTVYATDYSGDLVDLFALGPKPPAPETLKAEPVAAFTATLHGTLNPKGVKTSYYFAYNTHGSCHGGPTTAVEEGGEGSVAEEEAAEVAGLEPNTQYTFCFVAKGAFGSTFGPAKTFTTLGAPPIVSSDSASAITATDAELSASINPENEETGYSFEYATSDTVLLEGHGTSVKGAPPAALLPAVFEERPAGPVDLADGLLPGTTYFFRAAAENQASEEAGEPAYGPVEEFTTPAATPILSLGQAEGVTRTTARISGTVNPRGGASSYHVRYISQAGYEAALAEGAPDPYTLGRNTQEAELPAGNTAVPIALSVEELTPSTTYELELVATNSAGTETGPTTTFTTSPPTPPLVTTGSSENIGVFSATITGTVNTQGLQSTPSFQFATTPDEGPLLPATVTSTSTGIQSIAIAFSGNLQPATTYYYRAIATSEDGTSYGTEQTFTTAGMTPAFPTVTLPALIPYETISQIETKEHHSNQPALTRKQELEKALKVCRKKPKKQQATCRRQAEKHYGTTTKHNNKK